VASRGNGDILGDARVERTDYRCLFLRVLATDEFKHLFELGVRRTKVFFAFVPVYRGSCFHRGPKKELCLMPAILSTPTAQALDLGGDLVGGKVTNTVELSAGRTSTMHSSVGGVPSSAVV
jgi:hypothetical protein